MKHIIIELSKKKTSETTQLAFVQNLKRNFKLIEDTDDKYDNLRFVTIDGEDINIDLNGINIELRSITNPHIYVGIAKCFVYAVSVEI